MGPNSVFLLLDRLVEPLNSVRTDRKVDQILVLDRTDILHGWNKHTVGLPCSKKLRSELSKLLVEV